MNNKMRKEIKSMIQNEIFLYNFHVKKYYYYERLDSFRREVSERHCKMYLHSINKLIDSINICDSLYDYYLTFENRNFYSICSLKVEKVEG